MHLLFFAALKLTHNQSFLCGLLYDSLGTDRCAIRSESGEYKWTEPQSGRGPAMGQGSKMQLESILGEEARDAARPARSRLQIPRTKTVLQVL